MNEVMERRSGALAAPQGNFFETYAVAAAGSRIVGDLLRFNKGDWLSGQDQEDVTPGTRLVANVAELMVGWVKWVGGVVEDQRMGRVMDGFSPPGRSGLGDLDEGEWETDNEGNPRDPWQKTNYLILKDPDGDQLYTFASSSKGSIGAIGELCGIYGKRIRQKPDELPIVALGSGKYQHKNKAYGWIKFPKLEVVGWTGNAAFADALAADAAAQEEHGEGAEDPPFPGDDAIAEAAKKGKGGGKPKAATAPKSEF